jgi:hypothetical protein
LVIVRESNCSVEEDNVVVMFEYSIVLVLSIYKIYYFIYINVDIW